MDFSDRKMMKRRKQKKDFKYYIIAAVLIFFMSLFGNEQKPEQVQEQTEEQIQEQTQEGSQETEVVETGTMSVHFLDVGQGLCIVVIQDDHVLVYDGGDRDTSSFVVSYLKELGVTKIDYLISSHYDSDHVSGLIGCLNVFDVENVMGSNYVQDSKLYTSFMEGVDKQGLEIQYPNVGDAFCFGDAEFTILAPAEITDDSNANSVAIKLTFGEKSFIFTGDTTVASEKAMVESGIDLKCDVLSAGHHGSATSSSSLFLEKTLPEYVVISCSADNSYGHPHVEVMELLKQMEIDLFRNDVQGTVIATTDGKEITWSKTPCNDYRDGN